MERQLSAVQRDEILMNESKEDAQFKRDIAGAIRQSNETFAQTMQQMSMSILQVANGLTRSVEMMSHAILQRPQVLHPCTTATILQGPHIHLQDNKSIS